MATTILLTNNNEWIIEGCTILPSHTTLEKVNIGLERGGKFFKVGGELGVYKGQMDWLMINPSVNYVNTDDQRDDHSDDTVNEGQWAL